MKKLAAILVIAILLVITAAVYMWSMSHGEREHSSVMQARLAEPHPSQSELSSAHPVQPPPAPASASASASEVAMANVAVDISRNISQSPDPAYLMWRVSLPLRFPDVGTVLGLTPDEVQKLYDLLAAQQMELKGNTEGLLTAAAKDPDARLEMQRKLVEQERANEAALSGMLGSKYQNWQEYQSVRFVREHVDTLRANLSSSADALADAQAQSLIAALIPEQARLDAELRQWDASTEAMESPKLLNGHMNRAVENHRRLLDTAAPYLTPQQREEFWKILDRTTMLEVTMTRQVGKLGTAPVRGGM